ncbi:MAG: nitroreductase family protein [Treponemataceae bacterium]
MEMLPEIAVRRAFRSLSGEPLPEESVVRMLEAATFAPSCFNNQPWRFIAVSDPVVLEKVRAQLPDGNAWARSAPMVILAVTKPSLDCRLDEGRDYAFFDLGMSTMNLMLQAVREGIVVHPIAGFNPKKVKAACAVPDDFVLVTLLICGKQGENPSLSDWQLEREKGPRQRKPLSEVVSFNSFPV